MKTKLLLAALMLSISLLLSAESGTCGDNLTWTYESGTLTISGTGAMKDYTYSSSKPNTPWYSYSSSIKTVIIEDGVTSIGTYAFSTCSSLTSVTIPNSVTSIGESAFEDCSSLTAITIPNSVTSIGDWAFSSCSSLTSVTIPNSVTSIGYYAFRNCSSLPIIDDIRYVDTYLVEAVDKTLSTYTIREGTRWIGSSAFSDCSNLTSITIPNSVTSIGERAFYKCSSLPIIDGIRYADTYLVEAVDQTLSTYNIKKETRWIGDYAFYRCNLTSITIPNSVTSIGDGAFILCSSLTAITIPNSVTSIGERAFEDCWNLTSITIPNSVTSIGNGAFDHCLSLTSITIPNSVTTIGNSAFSSCSSLTAITIPNSVTSIGERAFKDCWDLTSVTIPNSVTSIGEGAFYNCSSLTSVTIPNSVTTIGNSAFADCSSLTSITCEAVNPPTLGDIVFYNVNKSIPLYVPAQSIDLYKAAYLWEAFTNIQPISSQTGDVTTPTVTVTTTSADIAWPQISGAASYELVIKDKSGNVVCTLVFDAEGHLTSLNFGAPVRDNIRKQPQAGTFSFTVTGLKENTEYTYTLTAKDSQGKAIDTKTGTFKTSGGTPVDETERDAAPAPRKLLKNGILRILTPDGITYDLQGHRLD